MTVKDAIWVGAVSSGIVLLFQGLVEYFYEDIKKQGKSIRKGLLLVIAALIVFVVAIVAVYLP